MRIFVAADVSGRAGIVRLQQELMATTWDAGEARPVEKNDLHFVLAFLGEQDARAVARIKERLQEVQFGPVRLTYAGIGGFPEPDSAANIWVGADEGGAGALSRLASKVAAKLKEAGVEQDRPFLPRVTILHAREGRRLQVGRSFAKYRGKDFGVDVVDKIRLIKSENAPQGRRHVYSTLLVVNAMAARRGAGNGIQQDNHAPE